MVRPKEQLYQQTLIVQQHKEPPTAHQRDLAVPSIDTSTFQQIVPLGRGRHGAVYLCRDTSSGQLHAVKSVPRSVIRDADAAARVMREKEMLGALSGSPGIATLRGTWRDPFCLTFVLEPALGGPLHKHIRAARDGHLSLVTSLFYMAELVSAVADVHAAGVVHRDLKASNVVLDARGHIKVVDLGCARRIPCSASGDLARTYCGTLHCMAPEMVARRGHSCCVDWWALGILLVEMLAGQPPFPYGIGEDEQDDAIRTSIRDATCDSVTARLSHIASACAEWPTFPAVHNLIGGLLQPEPLERLGHGGAREVQSHACFEGWDWDAVRSHGLEPPAFCKALGELEAAGVVAGDMDITDADQQAFAGF
ncbi:kinase-like domain-containing protein [Tribonema minus]|uniref:Kinase-like domain-containing protein n=1 Tax=Tribonema minus TaxID=303371 RepID=A0A835YNF8_9STRA|nr:kinase-like domain-containing protein [Tribonema minus]